MRNPSSLNSLHRAGCNQCGGRFWTISMTLCRSKLWQGVIVIVSQLGVVPSCYAAYQPRPAQLLMR